MKPGPNPLRVIHEALRSYEVDAAILLCHGCTDLKMEGHSIKEMRGEKETRQQRGESR